MAKNEAYRVKADATFHRPIREIDELADGTKIYETDPSVYDEGSVVYPHEMTPKTAERAAKGELDHLLEPISKKEADEYRADLAHNDQYSEFIAEHESEAEVLKRYGHDVVPKSEVLRLNSANAEGAREALTEAIENEPEKAPQLTAPPTPDLAQASAKGETPVPEEEEKPKPKVRAKASASKK